MVFLWVYGFCHGLPLCLSFGFVVFLWVCGCSFGSTSVSFLCVYVTLMFFRVFAYTDIQKSRGVLPTKHQGEVEAGENLFLTTTATRLGRGPSDGGCAELQE